MLDENEVAADLIAPGTSGSFAMEVDNLSEVDAEYTIELAEEQLNMPGTPAYSAPIEYSLTGLDGSWTGDITTLNADTTWMNGVDLDMLSGTKTVTVYWRWVYSTDAAADAIDTAIGIAAQTDTDADDPAVKVTATITVTQLD